MLLMDNFSAHKLPDYWKKVVFTGGLTGVKHKEHTVIFLPPNTTSVIQPLDQGTIMAFKAHYRRQHIRWLVDEIDKGKDGDKLKVDLRQVMVWTREARKHILGESISNCFQKSKILPVALQAETHLLRRVAKVRGAMKEVYDELTFHGRRGC